MRIAIIANSFWHILNFRSNLIRRMCADGHSVVIICPADRSEKLETKDLDCTFLPINLSPSGTNPFIELLSIYSMCVRLRRAKADAVISFTPKGNIYGGIAARLCNLSYVPNITGLGSVFTNHSYLMHLVIVLYRVALSKAFVTFFQNYSDREDFIESGFVSEEKAVSLPGSGVDLKHFLPIPINQKSSNELLFLLPARIIWDKGVREFVEAARLVKQKFPRTRFCIVGFLNVDNPTAVPESQITQWVQEKVIEYLGASSDLRIQIAEADCVVLPSYREGMPKVLLEAAACMRPIITTNAVGCREAVIDGLTGFICNARDSSDLAEKILKFIALSLVDRTKMAEAARSRAVKEFDEELVLHKYSSILKEIGDLKTE